MRLSNALGSFPLSSLPPLCNYHLIYEIKNSFLEGTGIKTKFEYREVDLIFLLLQFSLIYFLEDPQSDVR